MLDEKVQNIFVVAKIVRSDCNEYMMMEVGLGPESLKKNNK